MTMFLAAIDFGSFDYVGGRPFSDRLTALAALVLILLVGMTDVRFRSPFSLTSI